MSNPTTTETKSDILADRDTRGLLNLLMAQMTAPTLAAMHRDLVESLYTETSAAFVQIIDSMGVALCGEEEWDAELEAA